MAEQDYEQWYIQGLQALKSADEQGKEAAKAATKDLSDPELRKIAEEGSATAARHAETITRLLHEAGGQLSNKPNKIMEGIRAGTIDVMAAANDPAVKDASGVASAQISLHYYIAAYGTLAATAKHLGREKEAAELKRMTDEMKAFDERYTKAGEARANKQASQ